MGKEVGVTRRHSVGVHAKKTTQAGPERQFKLRFTAKGIS